MNMQKSLERSRNMDWGNMDRDYAICCKNYLKKWIKENNAEKYHISEDVMDVIIMYGGEGLHSLENNFRKILVQAKSEGVETIDISYVEKLLKNQ